MSPATIRALLIEDSLGDALLVMQLLSRGTGTRVEVERAATLQQGLDILGKERTDVVLLDLHCPTAPGPRPCGACARHIRVCRSWCSRRRRPGLPTRSLQAGRPGLPRQERLRERAADQTHPHVDRAHADPGRAAARPDPDRGNRSHPEPRRARGGRVDGLQPADRNHPGPHRGSADRARGCTGRFARAAAPARSAQGGDARDRARHRAARLRARRAHLDATARRLAVRAHRAPATRGDRGARDLDRVRARVARSHDHRQSGGPAPGPVQPRDQRERIDPTRFGPDLHRDGQSLGRLRAARHGPGVAHFDEGLYALLSVHDSGRGLDGHALSRIFDPFYTTKISGRGLGLAAALSAVRRHGGWIGAGNGTNGYGARFQMLLPIAA